MTWAKRGYLHFSLCTLHFALCILLFGCGRSEPVTAVPSRDGGRRGAVGARVARAEARGPKAGGGRRRSIRPTRRRSARRWTPAWPRRRRRSSRAGSWRSSRRTPGTSISGKVAGYSFKQVRPGAFQRVIVLGTSHYGAFRGFSIMDAGAYATPLGDVPLDRPVCAKLAAHELHVRADELQAREHSVEVELPFLQVALGDFRLVPILVGYLAARRRGKNRRRAARIPDALDAPGRLQRLHALRDVVRLRAVHPRTSSRTCTSSTSGAVDLILAKDYDGYVKYMLNPAPTICGRFPIEVLLKLLPAEAEGRLLKYDTSGRITGDFSLSVSYVSAMFTVPADWKPAVAAAPPAAPAEEKPLTAEEKKTLLRIARDTLEAFVRTGRMPEIAADALRADAGAQGRMRRVRDAQQEERGPPRLHREHRLRGAAAAARR